MSDIETFFSSLEQKMVDSFNQGGVAFSHALGSVVHQTGRYKMFGVSFPRWSLTGKGGLLWKTKVHLTS